MVRRAVRLARTVTLSLFDAERRRERVRYLRDVHRRSGWRGVLDVFIR